MSSFRDRFADRVLRTVGGEADISIGGSLDSEVVNPAAKFSPLTRFVINVSNPVQAEQIIVAAGKHNGYVLRDETGNLIVLTTSEDESKLFYKSLLDIKGLSFVQKPCDLFSKDGVRAEVISVQNGTIVCRGNQGVFTASVDKVIFDQKLGYYIIMETLNEKEQKKRKRFARSVDKKKREREENLEKDRFDLL
jgi:hypothetical protein